MIKLTVVSPQTLKYSLPNFLAVLLILVTTLSLSISYAETFSGNNNNLQSASELEYPPFAIVHPDGTAGGFSVDLLEAAARAAGLTVTF